MGPIEGIAWVVGEQQRLRDLKKDMNLFQGLGVLVTVLQKKNLTGNQWISVTIDKVS